MCFKLLVNKKQFLLSVHVYWRADFIDNSLQMKKWMSEYREQHTESHARL